MLEFLPERTQRDGEEWRIKFRAALLQGGLGAEPYESIVKAGYSERLLLNFAWQYNADDIDWENNDAKLEAKKFSSSQIACCRAISSSSRVIV